MAKVYDKELKQLRHLKRNVEIKEKEYSKLLKRDGNKCKILSL